MECDNVIEINGEEYIKKSSLTMAEDHYCIVRTHSAGVFAGYLSKRNGKEGVVKNARRIWFWAGAATLSQLAVDGTSKPSSCKFPCEVPEVTLTEIIEIIPCTAKARKSILGVPKWEQ